MYLSHPIPTPDKLLSDFKKRDKYVNTIAWAIPDDNAIAQIASFVKEETILEIGAGLGYWAKLLQDKGVKIIPTDSKEMDWKHNQLPAYTDVICLSHKQVLKKYSDASVLFLYWPPYDSPMATESLSAFKGDKLIYIGEGEGGCNGDDRFFDMLSEYWLEKKVVVIPQWWGIHDRLFLYCRKEKIK
jgi:uncharacterized UPF0146 family protein